MTKTQVKISQVIIVIGLIAFALILLTQKSFGSAPSGLPATVSTSSPYTVSIGTSVTLIATSTCAARIVSTGAGAVNLTFSDISGQTPSGTYGHWQAASTTVAYDSGQFGCGLVKAYGMSTGILTITETR